MEKETSLLHHLKHGRLKYVFLRRLEYIMICQDLEFSQCTPFLHKIMLIKYKMFQHYETLAFYPYELHI
jgi:hypothetical protein